MANGKWQMANGKWQRQRMSKGCVVVLSLLKGMEENEAKMRNDVM
jgi:hypothetical protein